MPTINPAPAGYTLDEWDARRDAASADVNARMAAGREAVAALLASDPIAALGAFMALGDTLPVAAFPEPVAIADGWECPACGQHLGEADAVILTDWACPTETSEIEDDGSTPEEPRGVLWFHGDAEDMRETLTYECGRCSTPLHLPEAVRADYR